MSAGTTAVELDVVDLTPRIASEVRMDRAALLAGGHSDMLRRLLIERGVLVFRKADLTDEELARFARTLGPIMAESGSEVLTMSLDKEDTKVAAYLKAAQFWHIDNVGRGCPNFASMLVGRTIPDEGGETEFANMYAAWEDLPKADKSRFAALRLKHSFENYQRQAMPDPSEEDLRLWRMLPVSSAPLVWRHQSGRTSLVLGSSAFEVEGMSRAESDVFLRDLLERVTRPDNVYRHKWSVGDLVVWDNSGTMHRARPHPEGTARRMSRVATQGFETLE